MLIWAREAQNIVNFQKLKYAFYNSELSSVLPSVCSDRFRMANYVDDRNPI